jgi:methyl farnesoate epoxidase/farnesoate epoxidase
MLTIYIIVLGKRICFGELFARNALFLFVALLVKTFEFKSVPNEPLPTLEPKTKGFLTCPYPFKAVVIPRVH